MVSVCATFIKIISKYLRFMTGWCSNKDKSNFPLKLDGERSFKVDLPQKPDGEQSRILNLFFYFYKKYSNYESEKEICQSLGL